MNMYLLKASLLPLPAAGLALSSCVFYEVQPPPDPYGDIAFDWSFGGITSCDEARVDEVDVVVLQDGAVVEVLEHEPCVGGGLQLLDFLEGRYDVEIDAFDRSSVLLYSGGFSIIVQGGEVNYAGTIVLEPMFDVPPATGTAALFWSFLYPTQRPTIDCALAGVHDVDVIVRPLSANASEAFDSTLACTQEGVVLENLVEGSYSVQLAAYGSYHNDNLLLFASDEIAFDVVGGEDNDLGDIALPRHEENFGDFDITWSFSGDTCATIGASEVTLVIQRQELSEPEDVVTVECSAAAVIRRTFVPGSYVVTASADGMGEMYMGAATVDLPPGSTAEVSLNLAP